MSEEPSHSTPSKRSRNDAEPIPSAVVARREVLEGEGAVVRRGRRLAVAVGALDLHGHAGQADLVRLDDAGPASPGRKSRQTTPVIPSGIGVRLDRLPRALRDLPGAGCR